MINDVKLPEIMSAWEMVIKDRYKLTDDAYSMVTFELAMEFLDKNFEGYPEIRKQFASSARFWAWWKMQMFVVNVEHGVPGASFEQWKQRQLHDYLTIPKAVYMEVIETERSQCHV